MTKRKGFTLIELLIVVVIIGVLSSMMSISSVSATDSAKASAILGNLSTMRKAALAVYIESSDVANATQAGTVRNAMAVYMGIDESGINIASSSYDVVIGANDGATPWYVVSDINGTSKAVRDILKEKAKVAGLYYASGTTLPANTDFTTIYADSSAAGYVALKVR